MSYKSPVTVYEQMSREIAEALDNEIMMTVRWFVDVDKEELLKALMYDRDQYNKGFEDAKNIFQKALKLACEDVRKYCMRTCEHYSETGDCAGCNLNERPINMYLDMAKEALGNFQKDD